MGRFLSEDVILKRAAVNPKYPTIRFERRQGKRQSEMWVWRNCEEHGEFAQDLWSIENGSGCPHCPDSLGRYRRINEADILSKTSINPIYPPIRVERRNLSTGVWRMCEKHGEFWQCVTDIVSAKSVCWHCRYDNMMLPEDEVWKRASVDPRFPPLEVEVDIGTDGRRTHFVWRMCPKHGEFRQWLYDVTYGTICPLCSDGYKGFDNTKPATVYYLRVKTPDGLLYKIGVTNRTVWERYRKPDHELITILKEWYFHDGLEAYKFEQSITRKCRAYRYRGDWRFYCGTGSVELFNCDILGMDNEQ